MAVKIKIVGIGGSGGNTLTRMNREKVEGVETIAFNTDYQDLKKTRADFKLELGPQVSGGLGTGMNPQLGEKAAQESAPQIKELLEGGDLIFLTYGAGGGTGTGGGPVVAEIAKSLGALTIAVITEPFSFEGQTRKEVAREGIGNLKGRVDSLIVIKNDNLLKVLEDGTTLSAAFYYADGLLREAVKGISDLLTLPGIINVNLADIRSVLENSGNALFGIGMGVGAKRAEEAAISALSSPLLNIKPRRARGILFSVSGADVSLSEIEQIGNVLTKEINPRAKIIFGASEDKNLKKGKIKVIVIVSGFQE